MEEANGGILTIEDLQRLGKGITNSKDKFY